MSAMADYAIWLEDNRLADSPESRERYARIRPGEMLACEDRHGPPYVIPMGIQCDYWLALAIARSKHPARVLANTSVYRYGRFTEDTDSGWITVVMMGQHIATFRPDGVMLWSRGYVTVSTSEALSNLVTGGYFYTRDHKIYFERYGARRAPEYRPAPEPFRDGTLFPYVT